MGVSIKDEPQDLVKFLLHHWCLGVEKFLIYDESTSTSVRQVAMQANTIIPTRYEKATQSHNAKSNSMPSGGLKRRGRSGSEASTWMNTCMSLVATYLPCCTPFGHCPWVWPLSNGR